jgi:hypothetical protein
MSPGTQLDPDRRDADVLFSPPEIYVARPCGDADVIDAEESGMYVVPGRPSPPRSIEPARHTRPYYTRNQHQPPSPNIVEPQPWRRTPQNYNSFVASGHDTTRRPDDPGAFDPGAFDPVLPDPGSPAPGRKTHLMIGLFEDRFGLYLFLSHTARRYLYLGIGLIILMFMGRLTEAVEFVIHFIF